MDATVLQAKGVSLTRAGSFAEAEAVLREALTTTLDTVKMANIFRDLADVERKLGKMDLALVHLEQSLSLLMLHPTKVIERASTLHYIGRFRRQIGDYSIALDHISLARTLMFKHLAKHRDSADQVQRLYLTLDYSSILALNGKIIPAMFHGLYGLFLALKYRKSDHMKRALVLTFCAFTPLSNNPVIKRAYFGRTH